MNIVILTGRFGMGHVKCANAIEEMIKRENSMENVIVIDFIEYCFPKSRELIYGSFNKCVGKLKGVYNTLAKATDNRDFILLKKNVLRKIDSLMAAYNPDLVIACLPMCSVYFSEYKKEKNSEIPFYVYITDISVHKEWVSDRVDAYFVGAEETKMSLIERGVDESIIRVSGIPVSESFVKERNIAPLKKATLLIMGGGLGLIPGGDKVLNALNDEGNISTIVICGKNKKLLEHINANYGNINAIGFTDNVSALMLQADALLTKPGGITTFEAINSQTPLLVLKPELEQEIGNAKFIEERNLGVIIEGKSSFSVDYLLSFLKDTKQMEVIKNNMSSLIQCFESANPVSLYKEAS